MAPVASNSSKRPRDSSIAHREISCLTPSWLWQILRRPISCAHYSLLTRNGSSIAYYHRFLRRILTSIALSLTTSAARKKMKGSWLGMVMVRITSTKCCSTVHKTTLTKSTQMDSKTTKNTKKNPSPTWVAPAPRNPPTPPKAITPANCKTWSAFTRSSSTELHPNQAISPTIRWHKGCHRWICRVFLKLGLLGANSRNKSNRRCKRVRVDLFCRCPWTRELNYRRSR